MQICHSWLLAQNLFWWNHVWQRLIGSHRTTRSHTGHRGFLEPKFSLRDVQDTHVLQQLQAGFVKVYRRSKYRLPRAL